MESFTPEASSDQDPSATPETFPSAFHGPGGFRVPEFDSEEPESRSPDFATSLSNPLFNRNSPPGTTSSVGFASAYSGHSTPASVQRPGYTPLSTLRLAIEEREQTPTLSFADRIQRAAAEESATPYLVLNQRASPASPYSRARPVFIHQPSLVNPSARMAPVFSKAASSGAKDLPALCAEFWALNDGVNFHSLTFRERADYLRRLMKWVSTNLSHLQRLSGQQQEQLFQGGLPDTGINPDKVTIIASMLRCQNLTPADSARRAIPSSVTVEKNGNDLRMAPIISVRPGANMFENFVSRPVTTTPAEVPVKAETEDSTTALLRLADPHWQETQQRERAMRQALEQAARYQPLTAGTTMKELPKPILWLECFYVWVCELPCTPSTRDVEWMNNIAFTPGTCALEIARCMLDALINSGLMHPGAFRSDLVFTHSTPPGAITEPMVWLYRILGEHQALAIIKDVKRGIITDSDIPATDQFVHIMKLLSHED